MDVTFAETPSFYGLEHLTALGLIAILAVPAFFVMRKRSEEALIKLLFILGSVMIAAEVFKQWFVITYIYKGTLSTWFFPWQLCSMAMYCSFAVRFLKGKAQDAVLVFLASFSLTAAVFALAFPGDMMRPQIVLFCHSFAYHGIMIIESIAAILILLGRPNARFMPAALLYAAMAVVAEIINVISYNIIGDRKLSANMFNITPYYPSTQPVFHDIAESLGIIPEIIIYLLLIALLSFGIFLLIRAASRRRAQVKKKNVGFTIEKPGKI